MDKFIVKRNTANNVAFARIAIRQSTFDMLKTIQNETGGSMVELIDAMVTFCAERLEVEE